jgi:hypothetical protein
VASNEPYNYPSFPTESDVEDFRAFPEIIKAGTKAPDPELTDLETGISVRLSDYSKQGILVVEFGSLT